MCSRHSLCFFLLSAAVFSIFSSPVEAGPEGKAGMVLVPAGGFLMGSPPVKNGPVDVYPKEETPRHDVHLDSFYIDTYEVTNEEFAAFLNAAGTSGNFEEKRQKWVVIRNDLDSPEKKDWWPTEIIHEHRSYRAVPGWEKYPVLSVSWYAADAYCKWAGKRLPTEAEWEKAARGGLQEKDYTWGDALPTEGVIFRRFWRNNAYPAPTEQAGNYYPNGYGLFDMAGNVSEWCSDWYEPVYYSNSPSKNPEGPASGVSKVIRGGSWASNADSLRVAFRSHAVPDSLPSGVGFRCARDAKEKK